MVTKRYSTLPRAPETGVSSSDRVQCHTQDTPLLGGGLTPWLERIQLADSSLVDRTKNLDCVTFYPWWRVLDKYKHERGMDGIIYIYPTPPLGQDMTKSQFLSGVYQVFKFRVFPSSRLVASPRLKKPSLPYYFYP